MGVPEHLVREQGTAKVREAEDRRVPVTNGSARMHECALEMDKGRRLHVEGHRARALRVRAGAAVTGRRDEMVRVRGAVIPNKGRASARWRWCCPRRVAKTSTLCPHTL